MTVYTALKSSQHWEQTIGDSEPPYQEKIFRGAGDVPIFGLVAIPDNAHSTIVGTYGITGNLDNQWFLRLMGRKAFAQGYAVVIFDWRAHGKTAELSGTLTSDGLYEGEDFVRIAAEAKEMKCPAPFWFTGFSLGGQLALWAVKAAQTLPDWGADLDLLESDIGGAAVICPSLDSNRSLTYLTNDLWGRQLEKGIVRQLKLLAQKIHRFHPETLDLAAVDRIDTIEKFDQELVIAQLGFGSVQEYYTASSALTLLPHLKKPTLLLYAADDPLFDPTLVPDVEAACASNPAISLRLTARGGHVGYISSRRCQQQANDPDPWWAWNRVLDWCRPPAFRKMTDRDSGNSL
ncbi:MAG: YheT family hydrolase [Cyanophyceae cyanobacterium]